MIKIVKTKNGNHTKLDVSFKSMNEAIEYFETNILPKETNKYFTFKYNLTKIVKAEVKEYIFIDDNEYFLHSYKIAKTNG